IVSAYLRRHQVSADQIPSVIGTVYGALAAIGNPTAVVAEKSPPAVPIRRSVGDDAITCLDCGFKAKMIKRHLMTSHSMNPEQYRAKWELPRDCPLVAKNYAAQRSALAKSIGLGQGRRAFPAAS